MGWVIGDFRFCLSALFFKILQLVSQNRNYLWLILILLHFHCFNDIKWSVHALNINKHFYKLTYLVTDITSYTNPWICYYELNYCLFIFLYNGLVKRSWPDPLLKIWIYQTSEYFSFWKSLIKPWTFQHLVLEMQIICTY